MTIEKELTVGALVADNIKYAHIFKKHGIDFCCGGGISIEKACIKNSVDIDVLLQELKNVDKKTERIQYYNQWELDFLVDYIVNTHHAYVKESLEMITAYASKVARVHGQGHPPVLRINTLFQMVAAELSAHLHKEELVLFPYIKKLVIAHRENSNITTPPFQTVANPIRMMEHEHDRAGDIFKEIALISNNYTPPDWACNTFKALYTKLKEFEIDLHLHVHLENNILFPKAIALESSFANA